MESKEEKKSGIFQEIERVQNKYYEFSKDLNLFEDKHLLIKENKKQCRKLLTLFIDMFYKPDELKAYLEVLENDFGFIPDKELLYDEIIKNMLLSLENISNPGYLYYHKTNYLNEKIEIEIQSNDLLIQQLNEYERHSKSFNESERELKNCMVLMQLALYNLDTLKSKINEPEIPKEESKSNKSDITKKIIWLGSATDLGILINSLLEKNFISNKSLNKAIEDNFLIVNDENQIEQIKNFRQVKHNTKEKNTYMGSKGINDLIENVNKEIDKNKNSSEM